MSQFAYPKSRNSFSIMLELVCLKFSSLTVYQFTSSLFFASWGLQGSTVINPSCLQHKGPYYIVINGVPNALPATNGPKNRWVFSGLILTHYQLMLVVLSGILHTGSSFLKTYILCCSTTWNFQGPNRRPKEHNRRRWPKSATVVPARRRHARMTRRQPPKTGQGHRCEFQRER